MKIDGLEGAAKLDSTSIRQALQKIQAWATGMETATGVDPLSALARGRKRVAPPPLAAMSVEGSEGIFTVSVDLPDDATGAMYHEIKVSETVPFAASTTIDTLEINSSTRIHIVESNVTRFFQLRSRYATSDFNRPQVVGPVASGSGSGGSGTTWLSGSAAPTAGQGSNGNFYLQTSNGAIYEKIGGAWALLFTPSTGTTTASVNDFRLTLASGYPVYNPEPATPSSTDTTADTVTVTNSWVTGTLVTVSATGGGLTANNQYVLNVSGTTVSFHTTVAGAFAGTGKVDLTASITAKIIPSGVVNITLYFTPWLGQQIALHSGSAWAYLSSAEVSLALGTLSNNTNYDVFAFNNSGTLTLELLAWSTNTVRATALARQDGVLVKSGDTTRRYVGSIRTYSTTSTIDDAGGISQDVTTSLGAKRFVYNVPQNRRARPIAVNDFAASWNLASTTTRQAGGNAGNQVEVLDGLGESLITLDLLLISTATNAVEGEVTIGEDSTTTAMPEVVTAKAANPSTAITITGPLMAYASKTVPLGYHTYTWLERCSAATSVTFFGNNATELRRSGMRGSFEC